MEWADDDFDDLYDLDGPGYFYVEDGFEVADELAERVIPDPPFFDDDEDWDRYDYFQDIEYDTDGYQDDEQLIAGKPEKKKRKPRTLQPPRGSKRKTKEAPTVQTRKRRRVTNNGSRHALTPPVLFLAKEDLYPSPRIDVSVGDSNSLKTVRIPSWTDLVKSKHAARIIEQIAQKDGHQFIMDDEELMDHDENGDERHSSEGYIESDEEVADIDPEALQMALKASLENLGLDIDSVDEGSLLRLANSMMAGELGAEDLLAQLAAGFVDGNEVDEESDVADDTQSAQNSRIRPELNGFSGWITDQAKFSAERKQGLAVQAASETAARDGCDVENEVPSEVLPRSKRKRGRDESSNTRKRSRRGHSIMKT